MKKKLIVLLLALSCILVLVGCGCKHEWLAATCENPKTCELCGETEGEAKGHSIVIATCEEAEHCESCNYVYGELLGHTWLDATTEAPITCETCGATEGERIITDPRFTTASTLELQGEWFMEVPLTGEMMGVEDFPGEAPINMILKFGNAGDVTIAVGITDEFTDAMVAYSVDMTYAEFAAQGVDKEAADSAFESTYGMSIQEYTRKEMEAVDFDTLYAILFEAAGLGGVYYVEDGLLYIGSNWDEEMEGSAYTLDGDSVTIDDLLETMGVEGALTRMTEE